MKKRLIVWDTQHQRRVMGACFRINIYGELVNETTQELLDLDTHCVVKQSAPVQDTVNTRIDADKLLEIINHDLGK